MSGAAPVPKEIVVKLKKHCHNLKDVIVIGNRATETGSVAVYSNLGVHQNTRNTTCGTPLDFKHGWYATGDLGNMNSKGFIRISGRTKELTIRERSNIYSKEVVDLVYQHLNVEMVAVCGVKHEKMGDEVVAWIQRMENNNNTSVQDIKDFCKEKISYYKISSQILFVDSFPVTASGKFSKVCHDSKVTRHALRTKNKSIVFKECL